MLKCPNCGAEYNDNTWFCVNCGTMLDVERDKIVEQPKPEEQEAAEETAEAVEEPAEEEVAEEAEVVEEANDVEAPAEEAVEEAEVIEEAEVEEETSEEVEEHSEEGAVEEAEEVEVVEEATETTAEEPAEVVEAEIAEPAPVVPRMPGPNESVDQTYSSYAGGSDNTDYDIPTENDEKGYQVQSYDYEDDPAARDKGSIGWAILGFFIPLIGLILFIAWHKTKPNSARNAGVGALVSVIVNFILVMIGIIIMGIGVSFLAAGSGYEDIAVSVAANLIH